MKNNPDSVTLEGLYAKDPTLLQALELLGDMKDSYIDRQLDVLRQHSIALQGYRESEFREMFMHSLDTSMGSGVELLGVPSREGLSISSSIENLLNAQKSKTVFDSDLMHGKHSGCSLRSKLFEVSDEWQEVDMDMMCPDLSRGFNSACVPLMSEFIYPSVFVEVSRIIDASRKVLLADGQAVLILPEEYSGYLEEVLTSNVEKMRIYPKFKNLSDSRIDSIPEDALSEYRAKNPEVEVSKHNMYKVSKRSKNRAKNKEATKARRVKRKK